MFAIAHWRACYFYLITTKTNSLARYLLPLIILLSISQSPLSQALDHKPSAHENSNHAEENLLSDDNLLIVEIILGKYRLASDIFIYTTAESTLVPLQPIFDAIEFPIEVDPTAEKAHGWFLRESNRFDLNVANHQLIIAGEATSLPENSLIVSDGIDLYADITLLKQWFPFQVELQTSRLRLNITSNQPLPIEQQLQREKSRKKSLGYESDDKSTSRHDIYRNLGVPIIDVNVGGILRDTELSNADSDDIESDFSYSVQASADILKFQGNLSVARSSSAADTRKRFTVYKRPNSPEENMIGSLDYAALGDTFGVSDGLIFSGGEGLGADLQFGGVRKSTDFDKRVIEGDAIPGWEAELYRNNSLVDFIVIGDDGRYRFQDVLVEFGENVFDVRLFGPQGQERSVRESIRVGEQALPKGKFYGRLSHVNLDQNVFSDNGPSLISAVNEESKTYAFVQAGISERLSGSLTLAQHDNPFSLEAENRYAQIGLTASLPFAAVAFEHAEQQNGGSADLLSLQTQWGNTAISYSQKHYDSFISDRNPGGRLANDIQLRFTGALSPFHFDPISYQLIGNYEDNSNGSYTYSVDSRLSFRFLKGRMTLDNDYTESSIGDPSIRGGARYLRVIGSKTNIRASVNYELEPEFEVGQASASITWRPNNKLRTQLTLNGDLIGRDNNNLLLAVSYLFDQAALSANVNLQEGGGSALFLNLEFSLGRENKKRWKLANTPQSNYGRTKAKVFLDMDYDGTYSAGDEPVSGIRFEGRREWEELQTDENGVVFLSGMRAETPTKVKLDQSSLIDPYWRSSFREEHIVSHPGGLHEIEVPIVLTAEAEGSIFLVQKTGLKPLAGIPLTVTDKNGLATASVTEFDGFYIISDLIAGEYSLTIDQKALDRLGINHFEAIPFIADPVEGTVYLEPIILNKELATAVETKTALPLSNTLQSPKQPPEDGPSNNLETATLHEDDSIIRDVNAPTLEFAESSTVGSAVKSIDTQPLTKPKGSKDPKAVSERRVPLVTNQPAQTNAHSDNPRQQAEPPRVTDQEIPINTGSSPKNSTDLFDITPHSNGTKNNQTNEKNSSKVPAHLLDKPFARAAAWGLSALMLAAAWSAYLRYRRNH